MGRFGIVRAIKFAVFAVVAATVVSAAVMLLWNWLMPTIFEVRLITFWQALGLFVLSRTLFGRFGGPGRRGHWRHRMEERWNRMSPEEREKFMSGMKGRPGPLESPSATNV